MFARAAERSFQKRVSARQLFHGFPGVVRREQKRPRAAVHLHVPAHLFDDAIHTLTLLSVPPVGTPPALRFGAFGVRFFFDDCIIQ